jgi:hypothetical protein
VSGTNERRRLSHDQVLEQRSHARRELRMFARRLAILLAALVGVVLAGTIAFWATEGVSVAYAFVWTLDTVTTLGALQDPKDAGGRVVVVLLEVFGIGTLFYGLATVAEFFVSGQLSGLLEERRNQRMIDSYSDHFIICGFGRVGRQVARDLGLRRAGADRIISPYKTSGSEMARVALHPQVGGALQVAEYRMEEIDVPSACEGVGKTVEQARGDAVIVAVSHPDGRLEPQPPPDSMIEAGDMLVAIGTPAAIEGLELQFQPIKVRSA